MTEIEELDKISFSLLKYMMTASISNKNHIEIYNEWTNLSNIEIMYQSNLKWALRFIKANKNNYLLKSQALAATVKEKEKKGNGIY